jgi:hypothetical protein
MLLAFTNRETHQNSNKPMKSHILWCYKKNVLKQKPKLLGHLLMLVCDIKITAIENMSSYSTSAIKLHIHQACLNIKTYM